MKKLYILALALLCAAGASAQTLKLYHGGKEISDGEVVTVTTYSDKTVTSSGKVRYTLNGDISLQGTADGKISIVGTAKSRENSVSMNFQVCPDQCTNFNDEGVVTNDFDYKVSDGVKNLQIHDVSAFAAADNHITAKEVVDFEIAYTDNAASKRKFQLVFNFDSENTAGVGDITVDAENGVTEYYNLSGVRVNADSLTPGLYIRRQGSKATKVVVK